jgi:hypothetical protein
MDMGIVQLAFHIHMLVNILQVIQTPMYIEIMFAT